MPTATGPSRSPAGWSALGADYLAVSSLDEAGELRRGGRPGPRPDPGPHAASPWCPSWSAYRVTQAVSGPEPRPEAYSAAAAALRRHPAGPHQGGHRHVPAGLPGAGRATSPPAWRPSPPPAPCRGWSRRGSSPTSPSPTRTAPTARPTPESAVQSPLHPGAGRPGRRGADLRPPPLRQQRRPGPVPGDVPGHGAPRHRPLRRGRRRGAAGPASP